MTAPEAAEAGASASALEAAEGVAASAPEATEGAAASAAAPEAAEAAAEGVAASAPEAAIEGVAAATPEGSEAAAEGAAASALEAAEGAMASAPEVREGAVASAAIAVTGGQAVAPQTMSMPLQAADEMEAGGGEASSAAQGDVTSAALPETRAQGENVQPEASAASDASDALRTLRRCATTTAALPSPSTAFTKRRNTTTDTEALLFGEGLPGSPASDLPTQRTPLAKRLRESQSGTDAGRPDSGVTLQLSGGAPEAEDCATPPREAIGHPVSYSPDTAKSEPPQKLADLDALSTMKLENGMPHTLVPAEDGCAVQSRSSSSKRDGGDGDGKEEIESQGHEGAETKAKAEAEWARAQAAAMPPADDSALGFAHMISFGLPVPDAVRKVAQEALAAEAAGVALAADSIEAAQQAARLQAVKAEENNAEDLEGVMCAIIDESCGMQQVAESPEDWRARHQRRLQASASDASWASDTIELMSDDEEAVAGMAASICTQVLMGLQFLEHTS